MRACQASTGVSFGQQTSNPTQPNQLTYLLARNSPNGARDQSGPERSPTMFHWASSPASSTKPEPQGAKQAKGHFTRSYTVAAGKLENPDLGNMVAHLGRASEERVDGLDTTTGQACPARHPNKLTSGESSSLLTAL